MYLKKGYHSKESNIRIKLANTFVQKLGMDDTTTYVYDLVYDEKNCVEK